MVMVMMMMMITPMWTSETVFDDGEPLAMVETANQSVDTYALWRIRWSLRWLADTPLQCEHSIRFARRLLYGRRQ